MIISHCNSCLHFIFGMDKVTWLLSWLLVQTTYANICDKPCSCIDRTADCTNLGLKTQFNNTLWDNTTEITVVKLGDNELKRIHQFPQLPIEYLSLYNNSINTIDDGAFKLLPNLTTLDLSKNLLHFDELRPNIFEGTYSPGMYAPLKNLKTLYLSHNQLHSLHPDLFEHLPNLESLFLGNNPFKFIDKTTDIAIASILNLKLLDLSSANLKELPPFIFYTPRLLSVLNLSGNKFTTIPQELEHSNQLKTLILDDNPIKRIDNFPELKYLDTLHINWMPDLEAIGPGALSNLTSLTDLMITHNSKLTEISASALSRLPNDGSEGRVWPIVKRLYLKNNQLGYLEHNLLGQWDLLEVIDLRGNPWVCDCRNQWMVSVLLPKIKKMITHETEGIVCVEPSEMRGLSMEHLQEKNYHMRCLDAYGHRPERDGVLLIGVIIGLFIAVPFSMAALIVYRRRNVRPKQEFSRAFYKRADSTQYFITS